MLQLIAIAGGLREYADGSNISIIRKVENGRTQILPFNYKDVRRSGRTSSRTSS